MLLSLVNVLGKSFRNVVLPRVLSVSNTPANTATVHYLNTYYRYIARNYTAAGSQSPMDKPLAPIVDIDPEAMIEQIYNEENADLDNIADNADNEQESGEQPRITVKSIDGGIVAPIDVDGWADDIGIEQGTVEEELCEEKKPIQYPPIPEKRADTFEFRGIKVKLNKSLLKPATYRYRIDTEDQESLADDIRVCKFDK